MTNQPLTSSDQFKIVFFALLLLPSVIFIVGIIPAIFLIFGIFMMKKNESFSHIEGAVKIFNVYVFLAFIICSIFSMYTWNQYVSYVPDPNSSFSYNYYEDDVFLAFLSTSVPVIYLILISQLFYKPLRNHQEWVEINGIFSSKPKEGNKASGSSRLDIIKGEKLRSYSVADELTKWAKLKEDGHVSEQEYDEARGQLLKRS
jgi:hypothetical protein